MFGRAIPLQLVGVLLALTAVLQGGCGSSNSNTSLGPGQITAEVQANNQPVRGVAVTLTNSTPRTQTTDAKGLATFTNLESGNYTVAITGFDATQFNFSTTPVPVTISTVRGPAQMTVRFLGTGAATGSFTGALTVNGQLPFQIPNQTITATLVPPFQGTPVSVTLTGTTGQLLFQQLVPGTYTLRVTVNGVTRSMTFTLAQGQQLQQNVEFSTLTAP